MPTWSEILSEITGALPTQGPGVFDHVRRKYLVLLSNHTQRNTILYATKWTQPGVVDAVEEIESLGNSERFFNHLADVAHVHVKPFGAFEMACHARSSPSRSPRSPTTCSCLSRWTSSSGR